MAPFSVMTKRKARMKRAADSDPSALLPLTGASEAGKFHGDNWQESKRTCERMRRGEGKGKGKGKGV